MITLRDVTLRRGAKVVLERTGVTVHAGEKVGLVGRNGAGKSSLFALLAGRLHADGGDVELPSRWRIGEVAQAMPETGDGATDFVLQGDQPLMQARAQLAQAEARHDGHAIAEAHLALEEAGAFDARSRAQALLLGLGFASSQLDWPVDRFSGGWRMRLQLARALMSPSDLLLLDEPTNHLDLDALVWLESWLKRYPGTLIVISHDREFLDAVTRVTLHVDRGGVQRYTGNYTAFEEARAERLAQAQVAYERQREKIAELTRFIDRFRAKASKAKQAQSRVKALDRMQRLAPVLTESEFQFTFREPASLPNPMLALRDLVCGYGSTAIVKGANRTVHAGQRIGILGANGQGKSTLVKTIAGVLPPLAGTMTEGKGLAIGYFAQQEMDLLQEDDTALQMMVRLVRQSSLPPAPGQPGPPPEGGRVARPGRINPGADAREQDLRNFLGQFSFSGEMVHQRVGTLSGGERARLVLATIVWRRPNLLLLDEPTNHLDLSTREALSIALNEFEGTVLLVSHDRALLREVCDEFWLVTEGGVEPLDVDLDDYQRWLLEVSRARARGLEPPARPGGDAVIAVGSALDGASAAALPRASGPAGAPQRGASPTVPFAAVAGNRRDERRRDARSRADLANRTRPLRVELAQIDARLEKLGAEKADLEAALVAGTLSGDDLADAGRRLNHNAAETAKLEERWLELSGQVEALEAEHRA